MKQKFSLVESAIENELTSLHSELEKQKTLLPLYANKLHDIERLNMRLKKSNDQLLTENQQLSTKLQR